MDKQQFVKEVNKVRKFSGGWWWWDGIVEGKVVYIKAYKTWMQRFLVNGINYANCLDVSVRQFNEDLLQPFK